MDGADMDATGAVEIDTGEPVARDYEAEARQHGWSPLEEFKGDQSKWVDAETFAKRADEVMPFLRKQNQALKREMSDLQRTMKQFSDFSSKSEERAYQRALADIEKRHTEAVELGDTAAAKQVMQEARALEAPPKLEPEKPAFDHAQARRELAEWVEKTGWFGTDTERTNYANTVADLMGPATEWPDGNKAWLEELSKRVDRRFAQAKPNPVNAGGNRSAPSRGGKSFNDLPKDAQQQCDKFVRTIPGFTRDKYVASFDWN